MKTLACRRGPLNRASLAKIATPFYSAFILRNESHSPLRRNLASHPPISFPRVCCAALANKAPPMAESARCRTHYCSHASVEFAFLCLCQERIDLKTIQLVWRFNPFRDPEGIGESCDLVGFSPMPSLSNILPPLVGIAALVAGLRRAQTCLHQPTVRETAGWLLHTSSERKTPSAPSFGIRKRWVRAVIAPCLRL